MLRFGSQVVAAMGLAWLGATDDLMRDFESLLLIGGSATFFWVGGLLDGFLLQHQHAAPLQASALRGLLSRWMAGLSLAAALAILAMSWLGLPQASTASLLGFAAYFGLETACQLIPYRLIATAQPGRLLTYACVSSLSYMAAVLLPILLGWGLPHIVLGLLASALVRFVGWRGWAGGDAPSDGGAGIGKELLRLSLPLVLATLLSQGAVYVDGYLVQHFFPQDFVAFRYGAREFPLVLLLANAMSVVRSGEIAAGLRDGDAQPALDGLKQGSNRLIWALFPLSIGLLLGSDFLFAVFFKGRFPSAVPVFDVFLLLAIPRLMFPQTVVRGFQQTRIMSVSAGVELLLNVGLSLLLMQWWGIAGIAAGTVLAFMVEKAILWGYVRFRLGLPWSRYASVPLWLLASGTLVGIWALKYLLWQP